MSASSLSAAKRRRAGVQNPSPTPPLPPSDNISLQSNQKSSAKVPIQNYLTTLEKRLMVLEQKVNEEQGISNLSLEIDDGGERKTLKFTDFIEGMDIKIQLLADELSNLKDVIIGLQKFTMEVRAPTKLIYLPLQNVTDFDER